MVRVRRHRGLPSPSAQPRLRRWASSSPTKPPDGARSPSLRTPFAAVRPSPLVHGGDTGILWPGRVTDPHPGQTESKVADSAYSESDNAAPHAWQAQRRSRYSSRRRGHPSPVPVPCSCLQGTVMPSHLAGGHWHEKVGARVFARPVRLT